MAARALLVLGLLTACGPARPVAPSPAPPATTPLAPSTAASAPAPAIDGGTPAPAASAACEGAELDLLGAIANLRCRISEDEADQLRNVLEDPKQAPLSVQASQLGDGRVQVTITNTGRAPIALPLLCHSHLDNFAVKSGEKALAPPEPDWPPGFSFEVGRMLSKIVLPPGGVAKATLRIDPHVVSHEIRNCPPNAKCAPETVQHGALPPGTHPLTIGTPLYSIRSDLEAKLRWTMGRGP